MNSWFLLHYALAIITRNPGMTLKIRPERIDFPAVPVLTAAHTIRNREDHIYPYKMAQFRFISLGIACIMRGHL